MGNTIITNIFKFFIFILLQVLLLNNIQLGGYINPYLYVLFILLLPFNTPNWLLLISSFLLGLSVDFFCNTMGIHAAASTFVAYLRPYVLSFLSQKDDYQEEKVPSIRYFGFTWFLSYVGILVFLHHLLFFIIEVFRFEEFFYIVTKVIFSTLFTLLFIFITQYLFIEKQLKRF